jgi:hypothetical protein
MSKRLRYTKKWIVLGIIILTVVTYNIYVRSYFRFENFKSAEQLIVYLNKRFPVGSDPESALILLKKAGASCNQTTKPFHYSEPKNAVIGYVCEYLHWELSLDLRVRFTVGVYIDKNNKIIEFGAGRYPEII